MSPPLIATGTLSDNRTTHVRQGGHVPADQITFRADDSLNAALAAESTRTGATVSDVVRNGLRRAYALDRPTYGPGSQFSLIADAYAALTSSGDPYAAGRVNAFRAQLSEGTALAAFALHTGNAAEVIPPGYSPLAAVSDYDRPLWNLTTGQAITSSSPFTIPAVVSTTGATAAHVELTNPSAGTVAFAGGTVSPRGYSGLFDCTREIVDASNPALDTVVLGELVESFNRQLEGVVADELATATPADTTAAGTIAADVRQQIARMVGSRRRRAAGAVVSAADALADALADGLDELSGDQTAQWRVQGVSVDLSADLGDSSGEVVAAVVSPASLFSWTSGPKVFKFEQVQGPGVIRLAVYGYAAAKLVRPSGVRVLTLT